MRHRAIVLDICCFLLLAAFASASDQSSVPQEALRRNLPQTFALTDARVVVSPDKTLEKATIVIRQGQIEAVGDVAVPPDARVISCAGRTIYPGFIDAYAEQPVSSDRLAGSARYWNGQITPQLSVADQIGQNADLNTLRKQGIVAQLLAPADGVIRGTSALVATSGADPNSTILVRNVAQHLQLTLSRRGRSGYPGSPMGAVALARQAILDAQWYRDALAAVAADPLLPAPEHNDALAALRPVIDGSMPVMVTTSNEQFVLRAERFAAEFGLSLIVRGSGHEYRRLSEIAAMKRRMILPIAFPKAPNVATPETAQDATLETLLHWDLAPENPARVDAAGIAFAFTSDRLESKGDFLKALRRAVERGLSKESALRALTVTPAAMFGAQDLLGTIQPGKLASLIITDGDVFEKKSKVLETWISGVRFEHDPEPARSADGHFQLTLQAAGQFPAVLYVRITDSDKRLQGKISRQPIPETADRAAAKKSEKDSESDAASEPGKQDEANPAAGSEPQTSPPDKSTKEVLELKSVRLNDTALTGVFTGKDWGIEGSIRVSLTLTETDAALKDRPVGFGSLVWPDGTTVVVTVTRAASPEAASAAAAPPATDAAAGQKSESPANVNAAGESGEPGLKDKPDTTQKADAVASKAAAFEVNYPLGAFGRKDIPPAAKLTALVHATIWTCGAAGRIEDATLVIADGKILDCGKNLRVPDGAQVIDVRGMHITPGIIDCHSHMATDGGVNEATQAITCEVRIGDFVDANDVTIYRQLAGGVTAANILHGSANPIGGQNQVIKLRWGMSAEGLKFSEAPQGVKFALGENVKQSNWSDATGRYPQTRMGVEQLYRDSFEAARDYARKLDAWQTSRRGLPPRRDLELDALREILEGHRWIHCHSYRQDEILALLRILGEYQITIGTFQHILEGYKVADEMAKAGAMASAFSDWWAYKFEVYDAIPHAGALMHKQGVVVSFNSDDGELARHLNQEAAKAVKYGGVDREEALKFVTLNPAKQLRIDHLVGSIESGKHADFVVWNGDPLSNFSRCEQTWIDGRRYFAREEDDQMQAEARAKRNTLIQKILESGEDMRPPGDRDLNPSELWPRQDEYCSHFSHRRSASQNQATGSSAGQVQAP